MDFETTSYIQQYDDNYNVHHPMKSDHIYCGNSIDILSHFPDQCIDLVVTDPPYLVNYKDRDGRSVANDDNPDAVLPVYDELYRTLKPHRYCITFCGWGAIADFSKAWSDAGFRTVGHIIWQKNYASRSGHVQYQHESAYLLAKGYPKPSGTPMADIQPWYYSGNKLHPTQKDVSVISPLIDAYSLPGDIVLDPFLGSGTTAFAANRLNRRYIGIELDPKYCEIAKQRLIDDK